MADIAADNGHDIAGGDMTATASNARRGTDMEHVLSLEVELLDPVVRADPTRLDALLHSDFVEHGASGRIWTRQAIIDELPLEDDATPRTTASDLVGRHVADRAILVTYHTTSDALVPKTAVRSSLWLQDPDGRWLLRFHQGTLTHS